MAIIKKDDKFQVRIRDYSGKFYPYKSFDTKRDAILYAADLERLKSRGGSATKTSIRATTFGGWVDEWSKSFRLNVSQGWKMSQDQMLRDHILPILARKKLISIKRDDIAEVLTLAEQNKLGPQMRIHLWALMHKIFEDAIEDDRVAANPVRKNLRAKVPPKPRKFLKPSEAFEFLEKIRGDYIAPAIWIMTLSGLRIGEMQGLTWGDIDFERGEIHIKRQWNRKEKRFTEVKNDKPIRVPMLPELRLFLAERKSAQARPDQPVISSQRSHGIVHYDTIEDGLKRLCKAHEVQKLTPHECRHTCTEIWVERGANITDVMRLLNHSSEQSTRPYIHKTEERLSQIAQQGRPLRLVQ